MSDPNAASWHQVTLAAIGDAVLTTDPDGLVTYMNRVAETLTGWSAAEAIGEPLENVFRIVNEETRKRHELLLSYTSNDLRLEADSTRLEQVLVNLLTNAAKYTPSGGRIQFIAGVEGNEVVFRVRDNGLVRDGENPRRVIGVSSFF